MGCGCLFLPFIGSARAGRDANANGLSVSIVTLVAHLSMPFYSALDYVLACIHSAKFTLLNRILHFRQVLPSIHPLVGVFFPFYFVYSFYFIRQPSLFLLYFLHCLSLANFLTTLLVAPCLGDLVHLVPSSQPSSCI